MTGRKPEPGKSLGDLYPKLLSESDYEANGEITPFDAFPHSGKKYWWICPICGGHYSQRVVKKTSKSPQKCPYCRNLKVLIGYNDLQSQCPELAKEWSQKTRKRRMKSTAGQRSLHFGYAENAVLSIRHQLPAEASLGQDARHAQTKQYGPVTTI